MAQVCEICGKGPQFGNRISHAHNVTKRRWNVNLRALNHRGHGGTQMNLSWSSARLCALSGK